MDAEKLWILTKPFDDLLGKFFDWSPINVDSEMVDRPIIRVYSLEVLESGIIAEIDTSCIETLTQSSDLKGSRCVNHLTRNGGRVGPDSDGMVFLWLMDAGHEVWACVDARMRDE